MSLNVLVDGLLSYVCLLILLTFHEFAHAWVAWKRGDDTAYNDGRVSLNPVVHMEWLGTVILPLAVVVLSAANSGLANFIIGWGRPVPVNLNNLRQPRLDDTLIALA
jgi:Zn-dependent protease